jgi:hypothetical protein
LLIRKQCAKIEYNFQDKKEGLVTEENPDVRINFKESQRMKDRVRINIWIPQKIFAGVMDIVRSEDETITDVIKQALKNYISDYKKNLESDGTNERN